MSASTFLKSTIILTVATILSKVLGSLFRVPLQNIAGDTVLGIFTLVYPIYMVALTLSVAGIPIAISKLISEARARDDQHEVSSIYRTAGILGLVFGFFAFLTLYIFSGSLADVIGGQETRLAIIVVALTLLVAPYMAVYRGYFQGHNDMRPTAISQVLEQFVRVLLILVFAYVFVAAGLSDDRIAGGVMIGSSVGAIASLIYLRVLFVRFSRKERLKKETYAMREFLSMAKTILKLSLPICVGALTMAILNLVDSLTVPAGLRAMDSLTESVPYLYGIYGRGVTLVQIVTVIATSMVLPLIPLLSSKMVQQDRSGVRSLIEETHSLTHFISWPAALGLVALAVPVNIALFTNNEGSTALLIVSLSSVFTALTVLGTGILQGMNRAKAAALIILGGIALKTVLNFLLVSSYGITGAAISTLITYIALFSINTVVIYRTRSFSFIGRQTRNAIVFSVLMATLINAPQLILDASQFSRIEAFLYLLAGIAIGGAVYLIGMYKTKSINEQYLAKVPFLKRN